MEKKTILDRQAGRQAGWIGAEEGAARGDRGVLAARPRITVNSATAGHWA